MGTVAGHTFEALVLAEHAEQPSFELDRSRISKLSVRDAAARRSAPTPLPGKGTVRCPP